MQTTQYFLPYLQVFSLPLGKNIFQTEENTSLQKGKKDFDPKTTLYTF